MRNRKQSKQLSDADYFKVYNRRDYVRAKQIARNRALRLEILEAYGGPICAGCGFDDERALQLDHIDGDGAQRRREIGGVNRGVSGQHTYFWLKKQGFPPGYQVLCANCNWIKRVLNGEVKRHG